jgi:hypothetical protein
LVFIIHLMILPKIIRIQDYQLDALKTKHSDL